MRGYPCARLTCVVNPMMVRKYAQRKTWNDGTGKRSKQVLNGSVLAQTSDNGVSFSF